MLIVCIFLIVFLGNSALATDLSQKRLVEGKFGSAVKFGSAARSLKIILGNKINKLPLTFECWIKIDSFSSYNILLSAAPKNGAHWEIYTLPSSGKLAVFIPQIGEKHQPVMSLNGEWLMRGFESRKEPSSKLIR